MPIRKFPQEVYEYKVLKKSCIATTRFNNKTYEENITHREKHGCIYTCTRPITQNIRPNIDIFFLEIVARYYEHIGRTHSSVHRFTLYIVASR